MGLSHLRKGDQTSQWYEMVNRLNQLIYRSSYKIKSEFVPQSVVYKSPNLTSSHVSHNYSESLFHVSPLIRSNVSIFGTNSVDGQSLKSARFYDSIQSYQFYHLKLPLFKAILQTIKTVQLISDPCKIVVLIRKNSKSQFRIIGKEKKYSVRSGYRLFLWWVGLQRTHEFVGHSPS